MTCSVRPVLSRAERAGIFAAMLGTAGVAWASMGVLGHGVLRHVDGGLGAAWASATAGWFVMMSAMMLPTVVPWVLVFAGVTPHTGVASRATRMVAFGGGYLGAWALFSLGAGAIQSSLDVIVASSGIGLGTPVGRVLLVTAGIYQLTAFKSGCLEHCRSPLAYFVTRWRAGLWGAVRMGWGHGLFCVACCWALMALAFVLGVMHLVWMFALTLAVAAEKMLPHGKWISRGLGGVMILAAVLPA